MTAGDKREESGRRLPPLSLARQCALIRDHLSGNNVDVETQRLIPRGAHFDAMTSGLQAKRLCPPKWPPPPRCAKAAGAAPNNMTAQPATTSILVGFVAVLLTRGASTSPMDGGINRRVLVEFAFRS